MKPLYLGTVGKIGSLKGDNLLHFYFENFHDFLFDSLVLALYDLQASTSVDLNMFFLEMNF